MSSLTIKNMPLSLHRQLKQVAHEHHRSINGEAIVCLKQALSSPIPTVDVDSVLAKARHLRAKVRGYWLTDEELRRIKDEGRP